MKWLLKWFLPWIYCSKQKKDYLEYKLDVEKTLKELKEEFKKIKIEKPEKEVIIEYSKIDIIPEDESFYNEAKSLNNNKVLNQILYKREKMIEGELINPNMKPDNATFFRGKLNEVGEITKTLQRMAKANDQKQR